VIPRMVSGGFAVQELMDLSGLADLRFIRAEGSQIVLGALATHTDLVQSPLLADCAPVLVQAARTVGAHQTRNRGTLGGNIANASPAGDTLAALLVLDAQVTLVSASGERTLPLEGLLLGPGKTGIRSRRADRTHPLRAAASRGARFLSEAGQAQRHGDCGGQRGSGAAARCRRRGAGCAAGAGIGGADAHPLPGGGGRAAWPAPER
jgi:hypothetical protein